LVLLLEIAAAVVDVRVHRRCGGCCLLLVQVVVRRVRESRSLFRLLEVIRSVGGGKLVEVVTVHEQLLLLNLLLRLLEERPGGKEGCWKL